MIIQEGYTVELKPNKAQKALLLESTAVHRKSYNYALGKIEDFYKENNKYPTLKEIHDINKDFTDLKKNNPDFNWFNDVSKCAHQLAIFDLKDAFQRFFNKQNKKPKFKSIYTSKKNFHFDNTGCKVSRYSIKIPKVGYVKFKETNRVPIHGVKYLNFTVYQKANRWYISVCIEKDLSIINKDNLPIVGIDVGIKDLITCSNGKVYNIPLQSKITINKRKRKHIRLQRILSKKLKRSKNRSRIRKLIAVNYKKICNIKSDAMHKITTDIAKKYPKIIIAEDLAVSNMMKNHKLADKIGNCSWTEIFRQIEYKSRLKGGEFHQINRFYPSSKMCSKCGNIKTDLKLSDRIYRCDKCGLVIGRDDNASINIKNCYIKVLSVGQEP